MKKNETEYSIMCVRDAAIFHNWYLRYCYIEIPNAPARYGAWIGFEAKEIPDPWRRGHYRYIPVNNKRAYSTSFGTAGMLNHPTEAIKLPSQAEMDSGSYVFDTVLWGSQTVKRHFRESSFRQMLDYLRMKDVGLPGKCKCRGCLTYA